MDKPEADAYSPKIKMSSPFSFSKFCCTFKFENWRQNVINLNQPRGMPEKLAANEIRTVACCWLHENSTQKFFKFSLVLEKEQNSFPKGVDLFNICGMEQDHLELLKKIRRPLSSYDFLTLNVREHVLQIWNKGLSPDCKCKRSLQSGGLSSADILRTSGEGGVL